MGGSIRCCPNCGEYVLPPAVQVVRLDSPPYEKAECVSCGWFGFTEDLRLKFIPTMLVGQAPRPFLFNTIGTAARVDIGGFTSLTITQSFLPNDNDMVVAVVQHIAGLVDSVVCGSTPMILVDSEQTFPLSLSMYYLPNAPRVASQVVVNAQLSSSLGVAAIRFTGYNSLVHSVALIDSGPNSFDSGPSPTQTGSGHIGVSAVILDETDDASSIVFGDSFSTDLTVGASSAPIASIGLGLGHRIISGTDQVRSTGTYATPSTNLAMVAVFKP